MIEIIRAQSKKELKNFIDFPHSLYASDENYVPELFIAQQELLDHKNPFFNHSEAAFFLAYTEGKIVGRIAAIQNNNYNTYTGENTGKFGFFDVIENYAVAEKLLDTAVEWLKEKGFDKMQGPENYSTNETCGTLIEGFDSPPTFMMTFNKDYYGGYLEKYGLIKDMDLLSYIIYTKDVPEKLLRLSSRILERLNNKGITVWIN